MSNMSGKKKKVKGPLRLEAIIPILIVGILLGVYFRFFFDSNLKSLIAYSATQVHGAEVNVAYVRTSFLNPEIVIGGIEVTDKTEPSRNLVSLSKIRFKLLGDALLRAKVVVEDASMEEIQAYSPRKSKGYILPPPKPSDEPSTAQELEQQALVETKKQYSQNVLGDIANVLGGVDTKDQLKNIQAKLGSEARIKEVESFSDQKEKEWKKRLEELPKSQELDALVKQAKSLDFSSKDPIKSLKNLRELEKIVKKADEKIDTYKQANKDLKKDYANLTKSLKDIDNYIKKDVDDLKKRFRIPDIDGKSLSQNIFMSYLETKLAGVRKYAAVAKDYIPKKKAKEESPQAAVVPPKRGQGVNVRYPITVGYPLFWLKKAMISSKSYKENPYSGDIQGELTNVTTAPAYIKKPAVLKVEGGFPYQNIDGIKAVLIADHTGDVAKESFDIKVASMPVTNIELSGSKDFGLDITEAKGVLNFNGKLQENRIQVLFENYLKEPKFHLEAKDKNVRNLMSKVFDSLPFVSINGSFSGQWGDLSMHIRSNLGDEITKGVKREIQAKVDEAKTQIEDYVKNRIGAQKAKVKDKVDSIKNGLEGKLEKQKKQVQSKVDEAKGQLKEGQNAQKKKSKEDLKKGLKKLFKF